MIHHPTKTHVPVTALTTNDRKNDSLTTANSSRKDQSSFHMFHGSLNSLDIISNNNNNNRSIDAGGDGGSASPIIRSKPVIDSSSSSDGSDLEANKHHQTDDDDDVTTQRKLAELQAQVVSLSKQLQDSKRLHAKKDQDIITLTNKVGHQDEWMGRKDNLADKLLADYLQGRLEKKQVELSQKTLMEMPHVRDVVDDIQRWLFTKGAGMKNVKSLIVEYCIYCRSMIGLPFDRLSVSGMMFHNDVSAYSWKWEEGRAFEETDIPHTNGEWNHHHHQSKPKKVMTTNAALWELNVREFRMTRGDGTTTIPPECAWFETEGYQDYIALPVFHRGDYTGKITWSTKHKNGFSKENVEVIRRTMTAFSTVLRLHTNEIVVSTLTGRLEEEVARQTQELASANTRLAEANEKVIRQYQNQLKHFAMMSHEIRTPLNCIVGLSNLLLEEEDLPEEAKEQVELITESSDLLLAVVNDVLDYSKLATGRVDTCIQPTDIRKVLASVVATVRAKTLQQKSNLEIRERIEADIPEFVLTDGRRIQQVIFNLLGNAVKFGIDGKHVEFNVGVYPGNALGTKEYLKFSIKDYGKGISKEDMANIFQPFQQSSSNDVTHGGTGLGLAITRQLVRVLGGSIAVDSELGNWSEFVVKLPCIRHKDGRRLSRLIMQPSTHNQSNHTLSGGDDSESYFDDDDSTSSASYYSSMSTTTNAESSQFTGTSYGTSAFSSSITSRPMSPVPLAFRDALRPLHPHHHHHHNHHHDVAGAPAPPPVAAVSITPSVDDDDINNNDETNLSSSSLPDPPPPDAPNASEPLTPGEVSLYSGGPPTTRKIISSDHETPKARTTTTTPVAVVTTPKNGMNGGLFSPLPMTDTISKDKSEAAPPAPTLLQGGNTRHPAADAAAAVAPLFDIQTLTKMRDTAKAPTAEVPKATVEANKPESNGAPVVAPPLFDIQTLSKMREKSCPTAVEAKAEAVKPATPPSPPAATEKEPAKASVFTMLWKKEETTNSNFKSTVEQQDTPQQPQPIMNSLVATTAAPPLATVTLGAFLTTTSTYISTTAAVADASGIFSSIGSFETDDDDEEEEEEMEPKSAPLFAISSPPAAKTEITAKSELEERPPKSAPAPLFAIAAKTENTAKLESGEPKKSAPLFAISSAKTEVAAKSESETPKKSAPAPLFAIAAKTENAVKSESEKPKKFAPAPLFAIAAKTENSVKSKSKEPKSAPAPLFAIAAKKETVAKPELEEPKSAPTPLFAIAAKAENAVEPELKEPTSAPAPLFAISAKTETTTKSEPENNPKSAPAPLFALSAPAETATKSEPKSAPSPLFSLSAQEGATPKPESKEPKPAPASLFALAAPAPATPISEPKSAPKSLFALAATNAAVATPADRKAPLIDITAKAETSSSSVLTPETHAQSSSPVPLFAPIEQPIGLKEITEPAPVFPTNPKQATPAKKSIGAARPRKDSNPTPAANEDGEPLDDLKILVAEDNMINQKVLKRTLARIGLKDITMVENGKLAVEATEKRMYDIILMDLQMPVMDGLEATKIITKSRNEKEQSHPKVIFLSAHALSDYKEQAAEAGGDDFISKPYKVDIIKDAIVGMRPPRTAT